METDDALTVMAALATRSRFEVMHLLAGPAGQSGLQSGEIAKKLNVPANTLSTQLLHLSNARLVRHRRKGRNIIYSANVAPLRDLIAFLADECAAGQIRATTTAQTSC